MPHHQVLLTATHLEIVTMTATARAPVLRIPATEMFKNNTRKIVENEKGLSKNSILSFIILLFATTI